MNETWTIEQARQHFHRQPSKPHQPKRKKKRGRGFSEKFQMKIILLDARVEFVEEYKFHAKRKFRFDFAIPDKKIGIEYEGLMSEKSRHTTVIGYSKDTEKYNLAAADGWRVLRYTALTYGKLLEDLKKLL